LYGYSMTEYANMNKSNSNFIKIVNETDRNFFKKNPSLSFSRSIFTKKGEQKWIQSTLSPVKNSQDEILRYIVIEFDITHQKEVEEEMVQRWENTQTLTEHLEIAKDYVEEQIIELNEQKKALEIAKDKTDEVLNKVLPYEVAIQLKKKGYASPRNYTKVSLVHLNIRNFFYLADNLPIEELVEQLNEMLVKFDTILENHFIEKIKTVGGAYLGAGGVPLRNKSNPIDAVLAAIEMQQVIIETNNSRQQNRIPLFETGIGIHTGKVIAGVVGKNKLSYDIWGDTVNIASSIELNTPLNKLYISELTFSLISEFFDCEPRKKINLSSNEDILLYEVMRIKDLYALDPEGKKPNLCFLKILSKL
jgi:class 3 adenylate cyclase